MLNIVHRIGRLCVSSLKATDHEHRSHYCCNMHHCSQAAPLPPVVMPASAEPSHPKKLPEPPAAFAGLRM